MGLNKKTISLYEKYGEIADELEVLGCNQDDIYTYLPLTAVVNSRVLGQPSLRALKRSSPIRKKIIDYLFACAISQKYVTPRGMSTAAGVDTTKWSKEDFVAHYREDLFKGSASNWFERVQGLRRRSHTIQKTCGLSEHSAALTNKISEINRVLNPPQIQILRRGIAEDNLDNEYAVLMIAIKKYSEYLDTKQGGTK